MQHPYGILMLLRPRFERNYRCLLSRMFASDAASIAMSLTSGSRLGPYERLAPAAWARFMSGATAGWVAADSAGKKVHAEWTGKYDGNEYPVSGSPDIESLAYKKIDDRNYESTNKQGGKTSAAAKIVYSADGKTRTVTSSGTSTKGQKVSATAVYDKQ